MDVQKADQDEAVARSLVYLVGAVLLVVMFFVVGLFLEAELKQQEASKLVVDPPAVERLTANASAATPSKQWPWSRHRGSVPADE